jgi:hypothetical protein
MAEVVEEGEAGVLFWGEFGFADFAFDPECFAVWECDD